MIIQSGNKPIILKFNEDVTGLTIRATLWDENQKLLKSWTSETIEIDEEIVSLPLTQAETKSFPVGNVLLEIKWLSEEDYVEFSRTVIIKVEGRNDTTFMEV